MKILYFLSILVHLNFLVACSSLWEFGNPDEKEPILYSFERSEKKINIECSTLQKENAETQNKLEQTSSELLIPLNINRYRRIIWDILVTCDQKYLVSAGDDKTIRIWDRETGNEVRKILRHGEADAVRIGRIDEARLGEPEGNARARAVGERAAGARPVEVLRKATPAARSSVQVDG